MVISSKVAIFVVARLTTDFIFCSSRVSKTKPLLFCPTSLNKPGFPVTDTSACAFMMRRPPQCRLFPKPCHLGGYRRLRQHFPLLCQSRCGFYRGVPYWCGCGR